MNFRDICSKPGHHQLLIQGPETMIEVAVSIPECAKIEKFAVVGHPHPLQEGTMNNKVVTTTAKTIYQMDYPVIRFNFRGVGQSGGEFAQGIGETDDMVFLIELWQKAYPGSQYILAGFSFGSYVAFRVAQRVKPLCLILIAPPVKRFPYDLQDAMFRPTVIFQGDSDELITMDEVQSFANSFSPAVPMECFEKTGHFFHGKLIDLRECVLKWVAACH